MSDRTLVFVYGTLLSGQGNNHMIAREAAPGPDAGAECPGCGSRYCRHIERSVVRRTLKGTATTKRGFWLFSCGGFPAMSAVPFDYFTRVGLDRDLAKVVGEVYDVGPETLARLDRLEGVESGHYTREEIGVTMPGMRTPVAVQTYLQPLARQLGRNRERIEEGNWVAWSTNTRVTRRSL